MISILTLLIALALALLVTRIATVALTHTGLSRESAKFQARSAFTGVGFTTSESEKVVNHPIRRRILLMLMLLGNAGVVTAVSSLIISFVNMEESGSPFWQVTALIAGLLILWTIASSQWVDRHLSNLISRVLKRYTRLQVQDYAKLLHLAGDYQINELQVRQGDWLADQTIAATRLRDEGIIILGINRKDGRFLGAPDGKTQIEAHDTLVLYGRAETMQALDQREAGSAGNQEHRQQVADHSRQVQAEKKSDT